MRFRADPSSLRGSIAPVVTPFTADGELDTEGLRRLIGWQLDSGSPGVSLGGPNGAAPGAAPQCAHSRCARRPAALPPRAGTRPTGRDARAPRGRGRTRSGRRASDHAVLRAADPG